MFQKKKKKMLQEYSTLREIYKIFQVPKNKNQVIYIAGEMLGWLYISRKQYWTSEDTGEIFVTKCWGKV